MGYIQRKQYDVLFTVVNKIGNLMRKFIIALYFVKNCGNFNTCWYQMLHLLLECKMTAP